MKIDEAIHCFVAERGNIKWNSFLDEWFDDYEKDHECYDHYDYYYAESGLYCIRDRIINSLCFVNAKSPYEAYIKFAARSTECMGGIYKGRDYSYEDFVTDSCCNCLNDEGCDRIPIMDDGSIMDDFRYPCRDFDGIGW